MGQLSSYKPLQSQQTVIQTKNKNNDMTHLVSRLRYATECLPLLIRSSSQ